MKFLSIVFASLFLPLTLLAANTSWENYTYHAIKAKRSLRLLEQSKNITKEDGLEVVNSYLVLATRAEQLNRRDIAAWDYNNAAFAEIIIYRSLSHYDQLNKEISDTNPVSIERKFLVNKLKESGDKFQSLIVAAYVYLNLATLDNKLNDPNVQEKIDSNKSFLESINKLSPNQVTGIIQIPD